MPPWVLTKICMVGLEGVLWMLKAWCVYVYTCVCMYVWGQSHADLKRGAACLAPGTTTTRSSRWTGRSDRLRRGRSSNTATARAIHACIYTSPDLIMHVLPYTANQLFIHAPFDGDAERANNQQRGPKQQGGGLPVCAWVVRLCGRGW